MVTLRDIFQACSMIQRLYSYNLLTDKVTEMDFSYTICRPYKKNNISIWGARNDFSIKDNIKALKYESSHSFRTCQKKIVEFTDSTHTIYRPANIAKKAGNC